MNYLLIILTKLNAYASMNTSFYKNKNKKVKSQKHLNNLHNIFSFESLFWRIFGDDNQYNLAYKVRQRTLYWVAAPMLCQIGERVCNSTNGYKFYVYLFDIEYAVLGNTYKDLCPEISRSGQKPGVAGCLLTHTPNIYFLGGVCWSPNFFLSLGLFYAFWKKCYYLYRWLGGYY
jgi:hypothetical protein